MPQPGELEKIEELQAVLGNVRAEADWFAVAKAAQAANPHYFKAIIKAMSVMTERRKKYSGDFHPYYNFVDVARRTGVTAWSVLKMYLGMKQSRFAVSGDTDYGDEGVVDTLVDWINYAALALGWLLDKLTEDQVISPNDDQWEKIWPIVCFDFDGVFNQHVGWTGKYELPEILPGIEGALRRARQRGYTIFVCTARPDSGLQEVRQWIDQHGLGDLVHEVTNKKPPAVAYIDDKAILFAGDFGEALDRLDNFKPYWEK